MIAPLRAKHAARVAAAWLTALFASLIVGAGSARAIAPLTRLSSLVLELAGFVIALALPVEWLFFGWLSLAPFLQELFAHPAIGPRIALVLYQAPPLVLLVVTILRRPPGRRGRWFDALPAVYLVFATVLVSVSQYVHHDRPEYRQFYYTVGLGIVMYYVCAFGPGRLDPERVARVFLGSGLVVALFTLLQAVTHWSPWNDNGWVADGRVVGPLQNPAVLGAFLGGVFVFAVATFVWPAEKAIRRLAMFAAVTSGVAVALTYTRASILSAVALAILIAMTKLRSRLVTIWILACVALVIAASWGKITTTAAYRDRLTNKTNVQARVLIQHWSIELAKQKPLFGWGYGSFDTVKNRANLGGGVIPIAFGTENTSHNTFLTVLVEEGSVGLLLRVVPLLMIVLGAARFAMAYPRHRWFVLGSLGVIGVYVIGASAIDMRFFSFVPALIWVFAGLLRRQMLVEDT
jgi:O-antigen ligase